MLDVFHIFYKFVYIFKICIFIHIQYITKTTCRVKSTYRLSAGLLCCVILYIILHTFYIKTYKETTTATLNALLLNRQNYGYPVYTVHCPLTTATSVCAAHNSRTSLTMHCLQLYSYVWLPPIATPYVPHAII